MGWIENRRIGFSWYRHVKSGFSHVEKRLERSEGGYCECKYGCDCESERECEQRVLIEVWM